MRKIIFVMVFGLSLAFSGAILAAVESSPVDPHNGTNTDPSKSRAMQQAAMVVQKQRGPKNSTPSRGYWMGTHVVTRHKKELSLKTNQ